MIVDMTVVQCNVMITKYTSSASEQNADHPQRTDYKPSLL